MADAAMRIGLRHHAVVQATIVSDFVVRAMDMAVAINREFHGNPDVPLIRTLARDLGQDLDRAREYARVHHFEPDVTISRGSAALAFAVGRGTGRHLLIGYLDATLDLADGLGNAVALILGRHLCPSLTFSRDHDLQIALHLLAGFSSALSRVPSLALNDNHAREQALDLALERSRSLGRACAIGLAGRLCMSSAEGLAEAILEGALDDFTDADLTRASLADADLTGVRWSLAGTTWPPGTDVKALLARSKEVQPGSGVHVFTRRGTLMWQPTW